MISTGNLHERFEDLKRLALQVVVMVTMGLPTPATFGQTDAGRPPYTDGDWAVLPRWCVDSQDGPFGGPSYRTDEYPQGRSRSPRSDHWTGIFGRDFWALHHYCRALYIERRLPLESAKSPAVMRASIEKMINEYQYVIRTTTPAMPLLPEIYLKLGDAHLRLHDMTRASDAYAASRRLKPDYWPAYTRWIDQLIELKLYDAASELLVDGLLKTENHAELVARKRTLDRLKEVGR